MMEEGYRDSEKRRKSPESEGKGEKRGRLRSPSLSLQEGVKDICACVRLNFVEEKDEVVKWLRLKIPGIFLERFVPMCSSVPSSAASSHLTGKEDNNVEESQGPRDRDRDRDEDEHETPDSGSDTSSTLYESNDPFLDDIPNWKETICWPDPTNGPFLFTPLVDSPSCYTELARCAALGSVIYALGGDYHHIDSPLERFCDASGQSLTHPGQPLPWRKFAGSHITGGRPFDGYSSTIPRPTSSPSSSDHDDICHRFHFCDFSKQHPKWEVSPHPLITPRFFCKLLSLDGRIYAFGGNHPTDELSPFAEVYDPRLGYWEPLPNPPFGRLPDSELFVFPLPNSSRILVLGAYSRICYMFDTWTWIWSPCNGCSRLDARLHGQFKRGSSPVIVDDTIYWIHRSGPLCAYKLGIGQPKGKYYEGFITGFEGLDIDKHLKEIFDCPLALLPISKHLLGLFWCSRAPLAYGHYWGSSLHFSLLRVSLLKELELEPETDSEMMEWYDHRCQEPSLTASVVASLTFPFPMDSVSIIDAYLIDDDEESGKLLSSCTSYATLVTEVN